MSADYPVPHHAAYCWLTGDVLNLGLPPEPGHDKGHTVVLPATLDGARRLLAILQHRQRQVREKRSLSVGTPAAPIQYDLDKMAAAMLSAESKRQEDRERAERKRERRAEEIAQARRADEVLADLGLL